MLPRLRTCALDLDQGGHLRLRLAGFPAAGANGLTARLRDRVEGRGGAVTERSGGGVMTWTLEVPTGGTASTQSPTPRDQRTASRSPRSRSSAR